MNWSYILIFILYVLIDFLFKLVYLAIENKAKKTAAQNTIDAIYLKIIEKIKLLKGDLKEGKNNEM